MEVKKVSGTFLNSLSVSDTDRKNRYTLCFFRRNVGW